MRNLSLLFVVLIGFFAALPSAQSQEQATSNAPRFTYSVGGGYGIGRQDVGSFVGNSFFGVAGGGINLNRYFRVDGEYMYYDLGLRKSVSDNQGLNNASGSLSSISVDGIVTVPYRLGRFGAYGIGGVGFYDRRTYSSSVIPPGALWQPAFVWWDVPYTGVPPQFVPTQTKLGSFSKIAGGFNYGGGVTYSLNRFHHAKLFGEWRYHRAYQSDAQTIVMPITVGLRW